jgi:hypothetical protein
VQAGIEARELNEAAALTTQQTPTEVNSEGEVRSLALALGMATPPRHPNTHPTAQPPHRPHRPPALPLRRPNLSHDTLPSAARHPNPNPTLNLTRRVARRRGRLGASYAEPAAKIRYAP